MEGEKGRKEQFFAETEELIERYIKDRLLLIRIDAAEKGAKLAAHFVTGMVLGLLFFFILLFVSIMAGYYFAELTGSQFYGFGIIAGFYVLLFVVLLAVRKKYIFPYLINLVIKTVFDPQSNDEEEDEHHEH
ncbi:phage holin family protein [Dinghuibacter silviterrae]|uniref:Uncharacterized protein n=1 Tax=Dinghuibacter silviterrae TaxID=1539049 RepID=A0A4R8DQ38_9BACT|nr:phage holin family protein [Dinghuibacter silviterrae]TDX00234.1 hypothetical protein EDB95_1253 [Dinghuibacter silviterrae]